MAFHDVKDHSSVLTSKSANVSSFLSDSVIFNPLPRFPVILVLFANFPVIVLEISERRF